MGDVASENKYRWMKRGFTCNSWMVWDTWFILRFLGELYGVHSRFLGKLGGTKNNKSVMSSGSSVSQVSKITRRTSKAFCFWVEMKQNEKFNVFLPDLPVITYGYILLLGAIGRYNRGSWLRYERNKKLRSGLLALLLGARR